MVKQGNELAMNVDSSTSTQIICKHRNSVMRNLSGQDVIPTLSRDASRYMIFNFICLQVNVFVRLIIEPIV